MVHVPVAALKCRSACNFSHIFARTTSITTYGISDVIGSARSALRIEEEVWLAELVHRSSVYGEFQREIDTMRGYFIDVPPPYEPKPPESSGNGGGGDGDGIPILVLLGIIAAYAYGYAELVQFIGLAGIWAVLLFLPFTITLILIPPTIGVVGDFMSSGKSDDKDNSSEQKSAVSYGKSTDDGYRDDEGGSYDEETEFKVDVERVNGATVATVRGRIDAKSIDELEHVIQSEIGGSKPVILDVSNVPYISSSGLRMILLLMRSFNKKGLSFALAAPRQSVRELFLVSGFTHMLPIHKDLAEAIAVIGDLKDSEQ